MNNYLEAAKRALDRLREPNDSDETKYILSYAQASATIAVAELLDVPKTTEAKP
jgi:hypothetical protein